MYDELIKRLRNEAETERYLLPHSDNGTAASLDEAADAIEQLTEDKAALNGTVSNLLQQIEELSRKYTEERNAAVELTGELASKPRWIPVTERLPETPGEYMVAYHPCYWDRVHDEIKVGLDSFRGKTSWAKKKYQRVTHWMPLPKPPEEE